MAQLPGLKYNVKWTQHNKYDLEEDKRNGQITRLSSIHLNGNWSLEKLRRPITTHNPYNVKSNLAIKYTDKSTLTFGRFFFRMSNII